MPVPVNRVPGGKIQSADINALAVAVNALETTKADRATTGSAYRAVIGDGVALSYLVTHNLGTRGVTFSLRDTVTNEFVFPSVSAPDVNTVQVTFAAPAPAVGRYEITVVS